MSVKQGSPLGPEKLESLEKWEGIFRSGKSQGMRYYKFVFLQKAILQMQRSFSLRENSEIQSIILDLFAEAN